MARVLVVEDDEDIQGALLLLLEDAGYDVVSASSRAEALELIERMTFQLILTDSFADRGSAVLTSLQTFRVRAHPTPVGIITAWNLAPEVVKGTGFAFVEIKPFDIDQLLAHIAASLNTPLTSEQERQAAVVRQYFAALTARDWDAMIALCIPDVTYILPEAMPFSGICVGREAFRTYTVETFSQFPAARFEDIEIFASPTGLASRYRGTWRLADGSEPVMTGAVHFQFAGDHIQQIGVLLNDERLRALLELPPPAHT
jgi:CheY-like chemotaxis protein